MNAQKEAESEVATAGNLVRNSENLSGDLSQNLGENSA